MKTFFQTEEEKQQCREWIIALESGVFSQTQTVLQSQGGGFCCFGVATALFCPNPQLYKRRFIAWSMPGSQDNNPRWIKQIDYDFQSKHIEKSSLIGMNDSGKSFNYIAAELRRVYKNELGEF